MKKIVFLLILFFLFFGTDGWAASSCRDINVQPKINFETSYGQLRYDFSKNTREITKISERLGKPEATPFTTGLATVTVENEYIIGTAALPRGRGKYCVVPKEVYVYVGFSRPTIFISNELMKNTCHYNLVVLHEQTHQRINKTALDYFIPYFQMGAEKIARELTPIEIDSTAKIDAATDKITQVFSDRFDKLLNLFKKELAVEQGKLDNQINYSFEDDICKKFNAEHFRH